MAIGWISIHRKIQECFLWVDKEPFDRRSAWIDLLLLANHEDKEILFDGKVMTVGRGQRVTSILLLSNRWHWSRHKVSDFLNLLESQQMIVQKRDNKKTLLTIVNYDIYQGYESEEGQQKDNRRTSKGHQKDIKRTTEGHQKDTNNNDNNDNNDNNENNENNYGQRYERNIIPPTYEMVQSYCYERMNGINPQAFIDFYEAKGWRIGKNKMKDWQAAVRTWEGNGRSNQKKSPNEEVSVWDKWENA